MLVEAQALDCISVLIAKFSDDPEVLACCTFSLACMSCEMEHEERIFRDFVTLLPKLALIDDLQPRLTCLLTLSNLLDSSVRPYVVVQLLAFLKDLRLDTAEMRAAAVNVALTLTTFEDCRHSLTEGCLTSLLVSAAGQSSLIIKGKGSPGLPLLLRQVATALCNLSCHVGGRERMIGDGAVQALVLLAGAASENETRIMCLNAILNLSTVPSQIYVFIFNKISYLLRDLCDKIQDCPPRLTIADIIHNLTLSNNGSYLERIVNEGVHVVLLRLLAPPSTPDICIASLRTLATLLSEPNNLKSMLGAGVIPSIIRMAETCQDLAVLTIASAAIYNACLQPALLRPNDEIVVDYVLIVVAKIEDPTTRTTCLKAIVRLSQNPRLCRRMSEKGLVSTLRVLLTLPDKEALHYCSVALANLANYALPSEQDDNSFLDKEKALNCVDVLSRSSFAEAQAFRRCAEVLISLCHGNDFGEGVRSIIQLTQVVADRSREPDVVYLVGYVIFHLSANQETRELVINDSETVLGVLTRMMRGAAAGTQLHSVKALCNLACDSRFAAVMVRNNAINDFVVTTILRTIDTSIKNICVTTLFNLLSHESLRLAFIKEGVLWAILKLSMEVGPIQALCARAIFNLSFDADARHEMMSMNVATRLEQLVQQPQVMTRRQLVGVLYNLSLDHAGVLLQDKSNEVGIK